MNKSKVTVTILNLEYQIMAGSLEEEMYIRKTAKFIEDEAAGFMELGGMTAFNALVQATMNIADLLFKERATTENLRGQIVQFAERSTKLEKEMQRIKTEKVKKEKKENKLPKTPRDAKGLEETLLREGQASKSEVKGKREKTQEELGATAREEQSATGEGVSEGTASEEQESSLHAVSGKEVRVHEDMDSDSDGLQYNSNLLEGLDAIPIPSLEAGQDAEEEVATEAEKPVEEVATKPVKEVATKPVEEVATEPENPVEEVGAKPVEEVATKPVEEVATEPEKPVEEVATEPEKPVEEVATKPVEEVATEPEKPVEEVATEPEKPVEEVASEPEKPEEAPQQQPPKEEPETLEQQLLREAERVKETLEKKQVVAPKEVKALFHGEKKTSQDPQSLSQSTGEVTEGGVVKKEYKQVLMEESARNASQQPALK